MKNNLENTFNDIKIMVLTVGCINYDHDINHFEPIKHLFPQTLRYNYFQRFNEVGREAMNVELLETVIKNKPDYVFYITYQNQVKLDTLARIRSTGAKIIGWFSDDQWRFNNFSSKLAKHLDFQVTTSPEAYRKYKDLNFKPVLCQWGGNQRLYVRKEGMSKKFNVAFVGSRHGIREKILIELEKRGILIQGFGRGWNDRIPFDEMITVFNQSKINLNFSASSIDKNIKQIKGRLFEITMCGGFLLTDYVEGLEDFYNIDSDIVCFNNIDEAVKKIKYYLAHDDEREKIAESGYRKSIENHTWDKRLNTVFKEIIQKDAYFHAPVPNKMEKLFNRIFKL